ncbi:CAP-associated domain-containing protein [Paenibacillus sp.]|uniref:CAP-associated domain-containing protein n=1 Tax=Paenibacillus sp. TaxID=58172 RepID=UPI002D424221|nr:CAP-associated domain-containing protein [Paenibacillus sp.]HZG85195.1 CAP-associated domain-containing protein [Paenibacillus sp.]
MRQFQMRHAMLAMIAFLLTFGVANSAEAASFKDVSGHWAADTIQWGVETGAVNGFPDGSFRPNGAVTEAQFVAMLFRAFPDKAPKESGPYWYSAYYRLAAEWNWPVDAAKANAPMKRGAVAQTVAAAFGSQLSVEDAVAFLLDNGLAQGRRAANGRVDFGENGTLTRAEAVQFVRNAALFARDIGPADKPPAKPSDAAAIRVSGVAIGDTEAELLQALGAPARKDASEYGFTWYVYNKDYTSFAMVGVKNGAVVALYGNGASLHLRGLPDGAVAADARKAFGKPLAHILKGNTQFLISSDGEYDVFDTGGAFLTVFYDIVDGGVVVGALAVEKKTELSLAGFYGNPSAALRDAFERQSLDLANSARAARGLSILTWHEGAAAVARGHSEDMAENAFFSHTNLRGESLGGRLQDGDVDYRSAGENIAYGQTSAIFAHEGWMNSPGHRKNMLGAFERLGVGVAFAKEKVPYYTQNFVTP